MTTIFNEAGDGVEVTALILNSEEKSIILDFLQSHVDTFSPETDDEENAMDVAKNILYRLREAE